MACAMMAELVHRRPWFGLRSGRRVRRARIRWLEHPRFAGAIGLTRMPGLWLRSLAGDLATIRACGASSLVSLTRKASCAGRVRAISAPR